MAYFAKVENGIVTEVIRAEQDFIDAGYVGDPSLWVQTSYNTRGNVHYAPQPENPPFTPDGGIALRGNFAGVGHTYDKENDVFYQPRPNDLNNVPCESWELSKETWLWTCPIPAPKSEGNWGWDEQKQEWVNVNV
ncbi:hypothetical protein UFOVP41_55 [uncultured Caudovirales phage]|uniref:Uncharacterized protein n=1 Tax=uncultured Caudovirales phage TaxID=2100421 RepID=A0A6J5KNK7_9CAUD|nr:hypothetical protein UFOVP41_55 [uncultured Caudovirales phage]